MLVRPKTIRLNFLDRGGSNRVLYLVYKFLRLFHVAFWLYALPFAFLVGMYCFPVVKQYLDYVARSARDELIQANYP